MEKHLNTVESQLQRIKTCETLIYKNSSNKDINLQEWDFVISTALESKSVLKSKLIETIEVINSLLEDDNLTLILKHFINANLENFSDNELRTACLLVFQKITIDFDMTSCNYVEYKLSPFVDIELSIPH